MTTTKRIMRYHKWPKKTGLSVEEEDQLTMVVRTPFSKRKSNDFARPPRSDLSGLRLCYGQAQWNLKHNRLDDRELDAMVFLLKTPVHLDATDAK